MKEEMHNNLLAVLREKLPEGTNLTSYLSGRLNIGRESAYRRIRGEINFTFEEIIILSQNLGFSVDNIIGINRDENALFNIHMLQKLDCLDIYVKKMLEYSKMFRERNGDDTATVRISINTLPYFLHVGYQFLSKFRIYKWLYQNQKIKPHEKYSDFILPDKVWNAHQILSQTSKMVTNVTLVTDQNIFRTVVRDIEYFYKRGLLLAEDLEVLQKELYDIADMLEQVAVNGKRESGSKVEMYVSAVDLEASYLHYECGDIQFSQVRIFSISAIDSYDRGICRIQKKWIESLKRYSVLISESGEMQRFEFLKQQREYIDLISSL